MIPPRIWYYGFFGALRLLRMTQQQEAIPVIPGCVSSMGIRIL